jgi:hypothetical protein
MLDSPSMARVTGSDQYSPMWRLFLSATRGLGLLTVVAITGLMLDQDVRASGAGRDGGSVIM